MDKIYLVLGEIGEYNDKYTSWNVVAFSEKEMAEEYCKRCNQEVDKLRGLILTNKGEYRNRYDPTWAYEEFYQLPIYKLEKVAFTCHIDELEDRGFFKG